MNRILPARSSPSSKNDHIIGLRKWGGGAIVIIFSDVTKYDYIVLHNIIKNVMSILVGLERKATVGIAGVFTIPP